MVAPPYQPLPGFTREEWANLGRSRRNALSRRLRIDTRYVSDKLARTAAARFRRTGWTEEEYDAALARQGGRCAISGLPPGGKALTADHCHQTKAKRGLLHSGINAAIGNFNDNPVWLYNAAVYVLSHRPLTEWVEEALTSSPYEA